MPFPCVWEIPTSVPLSSVDQVVSCLLASRVGTGNYDLFLDPQLPSSSIFGDGVVLRFRDLVNTAMRNGAPIIIHGDYDVDGICGTALLWEALYYGLGYKNARPYIPDRFDEGYGLSPDSIHKVKQMVGSTSSSPLLITTDCGITSLEAVEVAKELGLSVIITDHHQPGPDLPKADLVIWTDQLCGAGISWSLAQSLECVDQKWGLDLAALATVADVQNLLGYNRALVKSGLAELTNTSRLGLRELYRVSGLLNNNGVLKKPIGTYELGWLLGPRLNASGRLGSARKSLHLLCTRDHTRAALIADHLNHVNTQRRQLTTSSFKDACSRIAPGDAKKILIVDHEDYHEGIIGLVAGKLAREFKRPSVAISRQAKVSKGSARSVSGFNMIQALRQVENLLEGVGGHPMAAGFSIKTELIPEFRLRLEQIAHGALSEEDLLPRLKIDAVLSPQVLGWDLWEALKPFSPYGLGNPSPLFATHDFTVLNARAVGSRGSHLKLSLSVMDQPISAIAFGLGSRMSELPSGALISAAFSLEENIWNGRRQLQLVVKDFKPVS